MIDGHDEGGRANIFHLRIGCAFAEWHRVWVGVLSIIFDMKMNALQNPNFHSTVVIICVRNAEM